MALTTAFRCAVSGSLSSALDMGTATFPFSLSGDISLANGTASGQADLVFADQRTLSASANEDLDLAGVLTSGLGATLTFATLKAIMVKAAAANTNNVVVSNPASNGVPLFGSASDSIAVRPGGVFLWVAPQTGVTVTAGTGDLINIANSGAGTGVTYDVVLIGTSA